VTSETRDGPERDRFFRSRALRIGFRLGAIPSALFAVFSLATMLLPLHNIEVRSDGEALSQAGARKLVLTSKGSQYVQSCVGPCDDLELAESAAEDSYGLKILGADGVVIARAEPEYVTGLLATRFDVRAAPRLTIQLYDWSLGSSWERREPGNRAPPAQAG
jgi:hypothetical protein